MGWYDRLVLWFIHSDRRARADGRADIVIPGAILQDAIRLAAREEGREGDQLPWETGKEHGERMAAKAGPTTTDERR